MTSKQAKQDKAFTKKSLAPSQFFQPKKAARLHAAEEQAQAGFVTCPVCSASVPASTINIHLDFCTARSTDVGSVGVVHAARSMQQATGVQTCSMGTGPAHPLEQCTPHATAPPMVANMHHVHDTCSHARQPCNASTTTMKQAMRAEANAECASQQVQPARKDWLSSQSQPVVATAYMLPHDVPQQPAAPGASSGTKARGGLQTGTGSRRGIVRTVGVSSGMGSPYISAQIGARGGLGCGGRMACYLCTCGGGLGCMVLLSWGLRMSASYCLLDLALPYLS